MDKPGGNEAGKLLKKGKKKHAKDELDRQKQAEKKRRRIEKAVANSAAIISALEKKRQEKKEQERQYEEGAAIAEAVALHVLIGEDSDEPCHLMLNKHRRCNHGYDFVGLELTPGSQGVYTYSSGGLACASHADTPQWRWTDRGISGPFSSRGQVMDYQAPYHQETFPHSASCPGFMAAKAVSSLQIGDHSSEDTFPIEEAAAAAALNRIVRCTNNRLSLYKEL